MAKINFDPELVRNIKIIYGDADLDNRTLKQLYKTWQTNPNIIRNAAQQKQKQKTKESYFDSPELLDAQPIAPLQVPSPQVPENIPIQEMDYNDLRMVQDFNEAFKLARNRGLKTFKWGNSEYGTELKKPQNNSEPPVVQQASQAGVENPDPITTTGGYQSTSEQNKKTQDKPQTNNVQATINRYAMRNTVQGGDFSIGRGLKRMGQEIGNGFMSFAKWLNKQAANNQNNRNRQINPHGYYQQGGVMNNQEELQKAFMAYLIQDAQAQGIQLQSEQDLQAYAEQLGEEGLKAKYQEFMQKMQGGMMARLGAKLEYYKKLKGVCPEGQELVYFKQGGRVCKACQKSQNGTKVDEKANAVDKFKAERAYKKNINKDACGSKMKVSKCGSKMKSSKGGSKKK